MLNSKRDGIDSAGRTTDVAEGLAIGASLLCLAHCLVLPLLLAWSPAVSRTLDLPIDLHMWIVLLAGPVSLWLLVSAARQQRVFILAAGLAGLGLLVMALVLPMTEIGEIAMSTTGSVLLAAAHVANWLTRHSRRYVRT